MDGTLETELLEAKKRLYGLLLRKEADGWTEAETNIAYELANDAQIQEFLGQSLRPSLG